MRDPVQEQLEAYNAHDLERFVACYAGDAVMVSPDGTVLVSGADGIRARYGPMFSSQTDLHAEVPNRLRAGAWVVDEEHVRHSGGQLTVLVAYEVHDDVITRVVMLG